MKPFRILGPSMALLLLFGACVSSLESGNSCTCGGKRPSEDAGTSSAESAPEPVVASSAPTAGSEASEVGSESAELALPDLEGPEWTHLRSRAGAYEVCWRSLSAEIPRNEDFTLQVWILRDGHPVRDAHLTVTGWMPEHGHGMLRRPKSEPQADGSILVEGMLLHMRGHWELFFEVLEGTLSETADFALDL